MHTIQVVLTSKLLKAADSAAKRQKMNRSALIRRALEGHLRQLRIREEEERDRRGYLARPEDPAEFRDFEEATAWPDD